MVRPFCENVESVDVATEVEDVGVADDVADEELAGRDVVGANDVALGRVVLVEELDDEDVLLLVERSEATAANIFATYAVGASPVAVAADDPYEPWAA